MTSFKLALPVYKPERSYELFKTELELWNDITDLADEKRGVAIALSLPDDDKCHLRSTVLEKVDKTKLKARDGLKVLIELLDKLLGEDELEDSMRKYEDFEDYKRGRSETIQQFIVNFEGKYDKIKNAGIALPAQVLAFKLLRTSGISREDKKLCLTGMDYGKKEELFVQAQKALKKYCGDGSTGGGCSGVSTPFGAALPAIKVEPKSEDVLKVNTFYGRGRGNFGRGRSNFWPHQRGRRDSSFQGNWRGNNQRGATFQGRSKSTSFASGARGERPLNPFGVDGRPLLCKGCGSFRHFLENCPESWENLTKYNTEQNKVNYVEENAGACSEYDYYNNDGNYEDFEGYDWENPEECQVVLYTGDVQADRIALTTEAQNCAVLDTACTKCVTGMEWLETYIQSLSQEKVELIQYVPSRCTFKFGAGPIIPSLGQYKIPATLVGHDVMIVTDLVDTDIPLLLSKSAMKKAGICINIADDTAIIFGVHVNLNLTTSGHYCVPIIADYQVEEVFAVNLDEVSSADQCKVFMKLHRQFGHPMQPKLISLMKDAGVWQEDHASSMNKVYDKCKENGLCRFKRVVKPAVALPLSQDFNDKVAMDLKSWQGQWILHVIDLWSRYTQSTFISRKRPSDVIHAVLTMWCGIFGFMKGLLTDNGGEFVSEEMLEVESLLNLEVLSTAAESPFQNGICERNHQVVDAILLKLTKDYPKTPVSVLLKWACMAKNSLQMWSGFSSHQLVFGKNPNLPNFQVASLSALEEFTKSESFAHHLNALHASRKAFIETESCQKIKKALQCKVRTNEQVFQPGDRVHYKRDESEKWLGPAKVIFQDGKIVFVRHGPVWVKVSLNRLAKVGKEFDTSQDKLVSNEMPLVENEDRNSEEIVKETVEVHDLPDEAIQQVQLPDEDVQRDQLHAVIVPQVQEEVAERNLDRPMEVLPRKSLRLFNKESGFPVYQAYIATIPRNSQNTVDCQAAKAVELQKLSAFDVYEEVLYEGQECISTRWILWHKGDEVRARLVARGFEEEVVTEKDSPTVGKVAVRLFLVLSASKKWSVKTTDIKSAFLQGNPIDREVFLVPPKESNTGDGVVWKLKRCLYGLNDAARKFYDSVVMELKSLGCKHSVCDPALFYFENDSKLSGVLVSHIDDFLHAGDAVFEAEVMNKLRQRFVAGKLMHSTFPYIGFQITQTEEGIVLDQSKYVNEMNVPVLAPNRMQNKDDELTRDEYTMFRKVIGSLNWVAHGSRPDLLFDLIDLSIKFNKANVGDLTRALKIARKLKDSESYISFPALSGNISEWNLKVYTDAALANLSDNVSSTAAHVVFLGDMERVAPLGWKANKIRRVVRSTLATEVLALQEGLEDAIYLQGMLYELIHVSVPIHAYIDNQSTIDAINSTKMVDNKLTRLDIAAIKQEIHRNVIESVNWVPDQKQLANCMTKKGASSLSLLSVLQTGSLNLDALI